MTFDSSTLDPRQSDFGARIAEIRGFDLATTVAIEQSPIDWPDWIPQVDGSEVARAIERPMVAITLGVWLGQSGIRVRRQATFIERLKLSAGTRIGLLLFAPDKELETLFWPRRRDFIESMKVLRPDVVVAPDFSVWDGDSRLEHRYAIVRSLRVFELLQRHDFNAIPHVYWGTARDQDDWIDWIIQNRVATIAIDLQCKRHLTPTFLGQVRRLRSGFTKPPHLLVCGIAHRPSLAALVQIWPNSSFTSNLVPQASAGRLSYTRRDGSSVRRYIQTLSRPEIHRLEVEGFEESIAGWRKADAA